MRTTLPQAQFQKRFCLLDLHFGLSTTIPRSGSTPGHFPSSLDFHPYPASPPYQPRHRSAYLSRIQAYPFHKGSTNFSLYIVHLLLPSTSYCLFTVYMAVRVKNWFYNLKGRIKSYKLINWTHIYWLPSMSQAQWDTANKTDKIPTRKVMI